MMRLLIRICTVLFITFGIGNAGELIDLSGYYKSYFQVINPPDYDTLLNTMGQVNNRVRLKASLRLSQTVSFEAAYDITPVVRDRLLNLQDLDIFDTVQVSGYRVDDPDRILYPSDKSLERSFLVYQNIDRAFFTFSLDRVDIFIGRQAIAWGTARIVNPTDILAPYAYGELDTEDRPGIDAVRVRVPIGFMGEFDFGCAFGEDFKSENSAAFTRFKYYAMKTDFSILTCAFRENLLVGFDLARSLGGAGFWMEAAHVFDKAFEDEDTLTSDYFRGSIGLDYSLTDKIYGFCEYHYNGAGAKEAENYIENADRTAYREGSVYFMGRHYLIPGATYQITPW